MSKVYIAIDDMFLKVNYGTTQEILEISELPIDVYAWINFLERNFGEREA